MFNIFKRKKRIKASLINKEIFDERIMQNKETALVTFSAAWCGACKMQKPLINDLADHHKESSVLIAFVDVDDQRELSQQFGIKSMPTTIAFQNGEPVFKKSGLLTRRNLEDIIRELQKTSE